VRMRLEQLAGARMTRDGVLVIIAQRHRTQGRNREDALERLIDLIRRATIVPRLRRPTKPSNAERRRRIEAKKHRGGLKQTRRVKPALD
jgi:ribosome-associated protein